ncbi:hypothetical protein HSR122_2928 [Halapricum desulfuricans]|uniref:Uncharacterized protein n=1 Tax=Halapricum desulfuricans TaxID=2841257 RepID=A0A897NCT6_9EURY|nr:hypothetical protein HSR122_2928 [Halapricum desulfuricans]
MSEQPSKPPGRQQTVTGTFRFNHRRRSCARATPGEFRDEIHMEVSISARLAIDVFIFGT